MYSPKIVKRRIEAALPVLESLFGKHYVPRPHSISTIQRNISDLNEISVCDDAERKVFHFTRALTPDEQKFILNERTLCQCNYSYWSSRYAYIKDITGKKVLYKPNLAQQIFDDVLAEMETEEVELILQFLKARRLGISTEVQLRFCHRLLFYPDTQIVMASDTPKKSDKLSKMLFLAWSSQPHWLRPPMERFSRGYFYEFTNGNRIDIEHGSQESDIGRGDNPNMAHVTEAAKIQNPESLIDAGLLKAIIPNPYVFVVFEGTAEGDEGWWHDKYWFNKHNYGAVGSGARMRPTFLPWVTGVEIYPTQTWLRTNQWNLVKESWEPKPTTLKEKEATERYVRSHPHIARRMGENWTMSREQMFYYEASIKEYRQNNTLHIWSQEMASDDVSAWQSRELSVFDAELRLAYRQACQPPLKVYGIRGGGIPQKFWPQKKDFKMVQPRPCQPLEPVIHKVTADWNPNRPPFEFEFIELKFKGFSETDPFGKLFVWEEPQDAQVYAFGGDVADGLGTYYSDNSALEFFRKGSRYTLDAQVAEFVSPDMSGADMWLIGLAVGTYYSVYINGRLRQPRCVPEINREGGKTFLREMKRNGWKNFHQNIRPSATRRGAPAITEGWYTDEFNREDLIQKGIQAAREEFIEINSPWLVSEMDALIKHPNGKIGAAKGKHDDRLFALWLPFVSVYYDGQRSTGKNPFIERREVRLDPQVEYPVYTNAQSGENAPAMWSENAT